MLASAYVKTLAIRNKLISKLYQLSGHTVAPTAYKILCVRFTSFVRQHIHLWLRRRCNTQYGWVVSPFPTGTFTRQDAPSLSWRDNVPSQRRATVVADNGTVLHARPAGLGG